MVHLHTKQLALNALKRLVAADTPNSSILTLKRILWSYPTDQEILNEIRTELDIEKLFISEMWPTATDYNRAVQTLKKVSTPEQLNPWQIKGKHLWKSYEALVNTVTRFGGPKDPESMLEAIKNEKPLPMPVAVRKRNGDLELLGGNTRAGIANLAKQPITALVIDEIEANDLMADKLEKDAEIDADKKNNEDIYNAIKAYFLEDGDKPVFDVKKDAFFAHICAIRFARIAKLRGLDVTAKEMKFDQMLVDGTSHNPN